MNMETVTKETIETKLGYEESADDESASVAQGRRRLRVRRERLGRLRLRHHGPGQELGEGRVWRANAALIVEAVNALFNLKNAKGDRA